MDWFYKKQRSIRTENISTFTMNTRIKVLLIVTVVLLVLSQFQPLLLRSVGAVDGTFGVRPISHMCLGLTLETKHSIPRTIGDSIPRTIGDSIPQFPLGDVELHLGLFHFRYVVNEEISSRQRPICVGQDLWFGE